MITYLPSFTKKNFDRAALLSLPERVPDERTLLALGLARSAREASGGQEGRPVKTHFRGLYVCTGMNQ